MKKNLLRFFAWILLTVIAWWIFINYKKNWNVLSEENFSWVINVVPFEENEKRLDVSPEENFSWITNVVPFEKKEKCLAFFDKYRDYLKETYEIDMDDRKQYLWEYEMFYNSELDTCICAYSMNWHMKDSNWENRPSYYFKIVDYLNWEKELFNCWEDTYFEHLWWNEVWKKGAECQRKFWKEKDKYKN